MKFSSFTPDELFSTFHDNSMSSKHVLLIYTFIIGLNAKVIVDLGLGNSTRTALAAAKVTGGTVYSCDMDKERYAEYEDVEEPHWKFFCKPSSEFLKLVPAPIDFVFHDSSHVADVVRDDLLTVIPMMRRFGMICVHDTQQPRYTLLEAVEEVVDRSQQRLSTVTVPYGCGLTIIRVEESEHEPIVPAGRFRGDREVTVPRSLPRRA